jgi:hypothetical protein
LLLSINTNNEKILDTQIICTIDSNERKYKINLQSSKYITNNKPNLHFRIFDYEGKGSEKFTLDFIIHSTNSTIHGWNSLGFVYFNSQNSNTQNVKINSNYTLSCPATVENVITTGAYVSR